MVLTPQLLNALCELAHLDLIDPSCFKFIAVGGAHCGKSLLIKARRLHIPVYEGYGLTEFGSVAILNLPDANLDGSIGRPLPGMEINIAGDGEIVLKTKYARTSNPKNQTETIQVNTGDYGSIDDNGFVHLHGRKSNIMVLPNGRNLSPEWIEAEFVQAPSINQSYVFFDKHFGLSALVSATNSKISLAKILAEIEEITSTLPAFCKLDSCFLIHERFTPQNNFLTANGRLRRSEIKKQVNRLIQSAITQRSSVYFRSPNYSNSSHSSNQPMENYSC